jgi:XTP/dITP diphosphohydrolase
MIHRKFNEDKIVVASHNAGKVREIAELLKDFGAEAISSSELNLSEPIEDGDSFIANAQIKARSAAKESGLVALADDSGLVVAGLNGDPGIHSARFALHPVTGERDFTYGMKKLWDGLNAIKATDRSAYFACALSICWPDGHVETFEGRVHGTLVWPLRGRHGFGYDPMFVPDDYDETFGEMTSEEKQKISHRANAFKQLIKACF